MMLKINGLRHFRFRNYQRLRCVTEILSGILVENFTLHFEFELIDNKAVRKVKNLDVKW